MAKFNIRNIYTETESELEGKKCILANTIGEIETAVNGGEYELSVCRNIADGIKPFTNGKDTYLYCYYDPELAPPEGHAEKIAKATFKTMELLTEEEQENVIRGVYNSIPEPFDNWMLKTISHMENDHLASFLEDVFALHGYPEMRDVLKKLDLVRSDDEAELTEAVNDMDGLSGAIANHYMDNDMSCNEKCERIKDWIQEVL